MHDLTIIITLAGALAVALVLGWITQRLGLSTLVGYLIAGIVVGPHTPGFVADARLATQMAELGVILLLFGVEHAWLEEFGSLFVCDVLDETADELLRSVRGAL